MRRKPGLARGPICESNREPLYRRLPGADPDGRRPADFLVLIPGLRDLAPARLDSRLALLQAILRHDDVLFADLNLPLNLLWVSVRQRCGAINEVSAAIRLVIPEARLVGHPAMAGPGRRTAADGAPAIVGARRALLFWRRR